MSAIYNYAKKYQKGIKNKFPSNPWFDSECKTLKRSLNDYAILKDLNDNQYRENYYMLKKRYKSLIQRKKREHQNRIRDELENFHSANQKDFWRFWDKLKQSNCTTTPRGKLPLQIFESCISRIQSPPDSISVNFNPTSLHAARSLIAIQDYEKCKSLHLTDTPITTDEVDKQIKNLKLKKAPGIDGISNEFFKCASRTLLVPLTTLFNYIWDKGIFPDKWSEGIIQPLHKKGSHDIPDNYRKLTMMACMGKIFESILNERFVFQSEVLNVNDQNQFGFCKKNRRTTDMYLL